MTYLKGIHFGSYWMGKNDIVYLMAQDLEQICDVKVVDTEIYSGDKSSWFVEDYSYSRNYPIRWLDDVAVKKMVKRDNFDFVICNAGGQCLRKDTFDYLKENNICTVGITLSDPDVYNYNGAIYSDDFDIFYTNSVYSLNNQYFNAKNVKLLPFAASIKLHKYLKNREKEYDIVIIGHSRHDRKIIVNKLKKKFKVGIYGDGWGNGVKEVHGTEHVEAINSGKIYLSFSKTTAGYLNVKVGLFEAVACRSCVVTEMFDELENYFKFGVDILGYKKEKDLTDLISFYLQNDPLREWIAENAYQRLLHEHTWTKRWETILDDIKKYRGSKI